MNLSIRKLLSADSLVSAVQYKLKQISELRKLSRMDISFIDVLTSLCEKFERIIQQPQMLDFS